MNDEILDKEISESNLNYKLVKKTLRDKLKSISLTLAIWIPSFFLFENYFMDDGNITRTIFYAGSITGYSLCVLFTPSYKKVR